MSAIRWFHTLLIRRLTGDATNLLSCQDENGNDLFRVGADGQLGFVPRVDNAIEWQLTGSNATTVFRIYNPGNGFHFTSTPQTLSIPGSSYTNGASMVPLQIRGRKTTTGAPTTGTWTTGDVIMDSAKTWWLCTAGGTPGTWV